MDMYSEKSRSIPQKTVIIVLELILLVLAYMILFRSGAVPWIGKNLMELNPQNYARRLILFIFSGVVFVRMTFMMVFLLRRRIPWEESLSVPFAFALYFIGFALFVNPTSRVLDGIDWIGVGVFAGGSFINTFSELQRHFWKKKPENQGKLFTRGLFRWAMHINYFGDILWVTGYAILTRNIFSASIPVFLFCFFAFYNIPLLDRHLATKYPADFPEFARKTKKLIPFIY